MSACRTFALEHATDWPGFRQAARAALQAGCAPEHALFHVAGAAEDADLFAAAAPAPDHAAPEPEKSATPPVAMPRALVALCERVLLHRDADRLALMYRVLWRMAHEPALRHDPLDPDLARLRRMADAVGRDMHKMRAFVRFRPVDDGAGEPLHVAWFEPDHRIAAANAAFFVQRFTQMRWAILTPDASVRWDGGALQLGPGATRADTPAPDAGEALWLTYYRSTFNPARLKLAMMRREMPTRYWKNLPEAALIDGLARAAHERSARMVAAEATTPRRRLPARAPR